MTVADLLKIETTTAFKPEDEFGYPQPMLDLEPIFKDNETPFHNA